MHSSGKQCNFAARNIKNMNNTIFIKYDNAEKKKEAFMRSVNLRKDWEATMRVRMKEAGIIL